MKNKLPKVFQNQINQPVHNNLDIYYSKENNSNSISNSKEKDSKGKTFIKQTLDEVKEVIDFLNQKLNTRYRYDNTKTQSHIKARFNDGFTVEDFYKVIETKYNEWYGTDQAKYLRPETLFGTKFESYLNQKTVEKKKEEEYHVKTSRI